jgi:small-conductance mechanosensitive channel
MKRKFVFSLPIILLLVLLNGSLIACAPQTPPSTPAAGEATAEPAATTSAAEESGLNVADVQEAAAAVSARTPEPTATPSVIERQISELTESSGLAGQMFLGLTADDWINLAISVLFFVGAYLLTVRLLYHLLKRLVDHSSHKFYDDLFKAIGPDLRWLVALFLLRIAVFRLDFWSDSFRLVMDDIFFIVRLLLLTLIALRLVNFTVDWYKKNLEPTKDEAQLDPIILLLQHSSYILVISTAVVIALAHFGIASNILTALLIIIVIGLILIARDTIADVINGLIILVDRPFRVGDAIQLEDWPEWGWVAEIGSRTTRVRSWDNRLLTIPNASINTSQVINYTYPDPTYRMQTDVRLAYGTDLARIRRVIKQALQGVDEVLPDKPVEVYFRQFGNSTRLIRVHWWVSNCDKEYYMADRVNAALEEALAEAGFEISFTTYKVDLSPDRNTAGLVMQAGLDKDGK